MSAQVIPFIYNDKPIRTVERNGEPWFVGKDVCNVLEIKNANDAFSRLDEDEKGVANADPLSTYARGGGSQEMIIISEAGVYRLVFTSRKAEAEDFKRWLAHEVLPQLRRTGKYAPDREGILPQHMQDEPTHVMRMKIDMVKEARTTWGNREAKALWLKLGLPDLRNLPLGPMPREQEPMAALTLLLDTELPPDGWSPMGPVDLRTRIERAFDSEEERLLLVPLGIKIMDEPEGFVVSNMSKFAASVFDGTEWCFRRWQRTLRRLPGAEPAKTRFGDLSARGTFIPAELLDVIAPS
ncbi:MAG: Bro-N domain-containing protein [Hyphomicrobiales bacterium]|jgi:prophage antirepressor-like protein|nr:Bro-N domain-containing protein [Hyphomicrobiales bacterium]